MTSLLGCSESRTRTSTNVKLGLEGLSVLGAWRTGSKSSMESTVHSEVAEIRCEGWEFPSKLSWVPKNKRGYVLTHGRIPRLGPNFNLVMGTQNSGYHAVRPCQISCIAAMVAWSSTEAAIASSINCDSINGLPEVKRTIVFTAKYCAAFWQRERASCSAVRT